MTTPTTDHQTAVEIARLRAEFQATNANIERIATTVETVLGDHEKRLRTVESAHLKTSGVLTLIGWLGASAATGTVIFLSKHV